ncbi:melibiose permease [Butyrivibrio sp. Su6]|uniref:glycoside-pentoside-hexuronide (GPH):cation symporter n=1 Tax=Butyrivibrio sp. Su6 TaxID=1520810 RepID=UPI00089E6E59|nr:glycoside-pentoside-hexuronide (GPH):cation symporter [Butyrivibrio sp. Su6]SEG25294.1 melibiose permease [Butyrivibrio sp. Su6]
MEKAKLSGAAKASYGLGAVGKDMVYMLSASYVLYYFQDILGVSAAAMGVILMVARVFDAFNDPIMGAIVAKTKTRWGKFRPWLLIGTITNAIVLYLMFSAPPTLSGSGLVAYAAVTYIVWGVTYTMMDIPYWSMIPAFTEGGKEREGLTTLARSCAGVGSAVITIITVMSVSALGRTFGPAGISDREVERIGFSYFSIAVAVLFVLFTVICCINVKEKATTDMKSASIGEMFKALIQNDQAMAVTVAIVIVNCSIYITSNLVIYFFKYDFGGTGWRGDYTLFSTFGGGIQILAMMLLYPFLRKFFSSIQIYYVSLGMAIAGYISLLVLASTSMSNVFLLFVPGFFIFAANGMLAVITTVFLANTVDYGDLKNKRRDESVIFSMQTFVVKLASGISALIASLALQILALSQDVEETAEKIDYSLGVEAAQKMGLRMTMTLIPIAGLIFAIFWFKKKYILTDEKLQEISVELVKRETEKMK